MEVREQRYHSNFRQRNIVFVREHRLVVLSHGYNGSGALQRVPEEPRVRIVVKFIRVDCHGHRPSRKVTAKMRDEELVIAEMGVDQTEPKGLNPVREEAG